jgi:hypothetical protein
MKKKIIGFLICILFFTTGVASAANSVVINNENNIEEIRGNRLLIFGRMEKIDFYGDSIDFKIISFVFIKDGKDIYRFNNGETIRFFAPMVGVLFNKLVIGFFSDWAIIE